MDCRERFSIELVSRKRVVCPHCGAKLIIENSKCCMDKQHVYVAITDTSGEFQIIRNFEIWAYYKEKLHACKKRNRLCEALSISNRGIS